MWANKIIDISITILAFIIVPVQLVTTLVLGLLVSLTFGLLLFPISLIWIALFLGPLLALSWLWQKAPLLRIPVGIVGIPIAILGSIFTSLMPSMGETESRVTKLLLCETWPFSLECWAFTTGKQIDIQEDDSELRTVLYGLSRRNPTYQHYLNKWEATSNVTKSA